MNSMYIPIKYRELLFLAIQLGRGLSWVLLDQCFFDAGGQTKCETMVEDKGTEFYNKTRAEKICLHPAL